MAQAYYSFLDVAALDGVRQRFAAGDALAILSADLGEVIWANGPGAALFGHAEVETILGVEAPLGAAAKRQIGALGGFPAIGRDRPLLVRVTLGVSSAALRFLASAVTLPDGEAAILLAQPANEGREGEAVALAVGGFAHAGHFLAFVDRAGGVEAASAGFGRLGLAQPALAEMAGEANEERRIVKRLLAGRRGPLPAGLARLTADRNLLVVIDENWEAAEEAEAGAQAPEPAEPAREFWYLGSEHVATETQTPGASETEAASEAAHATAAEDRQEPSAGTPGEAPASKEPAGEAEPAVVEQASPPVPSQDHPAGKDAQALHEAKPVRFVWRTDRDGKFSQLSPEFAAAVGEKAADVLGRRFQDVADVFALDPDGEIAGLLARRDTWSGRTVFWPVAGTDRKIPVDLAALPVYDRNRAFEGFRGFGVARPADAAVDPEGLGLVLTPIPVAAPEEPREAGSPGAGAAGQPAAAGDTEAATAAAPEGRQADPFKGETPALSVAAAHDRRYSDKVIRLAEHRPPTPERTPAAGNQKALSTGERIAFQQIGERLKQDSGKARRDAETAAAPAAPAPERTRADAGVQHEAEASGQDREDGAAQAPVAEGKPAEAANLAGAAAELRARDAADEGKPAQPAAETGGEAPATPAAKKPRPGMSLLDLAEWGREETQAEAPAAQVETEEAAAAEARVGDEIVAASDDDADAGDQPATVDGGVRDAAAEAAGAGPTADGQHEGPAAPVGPPEAHAATDETFGLSILEKLPVPVLVHSGDTLHYANDQFFALTGYASVDELAKAGGIGALFADPYEDEAAQPADRHMRLKTKGGDEFPVEAFLQSVPWGEGKALILVLSRIRDGFGGQSPLIAELEARVAEMRTIIDTATDGVVLIARDGNIRSISRPAEALFGIDSDEVAGQPFASLFAIESQKAARDYLAGLSEHGVASVLNDGREVIGREAEGRFIPLFMTIGRLPGDSGFCAVVRDITQWKRAEEELTQARATAERSSSHKTEFLARVSHEIRTPLNAIIGFSELMMDEKFGPVANDRYRDYLRDINRSGNHVLDLVNDLLDISKIEAGQQEMAYEAVSLNETLAETVALMQPQANRERVIIRSSFASKLPDVVADLRSVRQIALNVLSNAVRYTQAGGQVIVSTAYENSGEVVMRVRDTGIGMTPAEIEQALKPFKQINSLKRTRGDGTGLGLPLTKAMVEANRAKFSIHSTPGEGTLVEVAFPSTRVLAD